MTSQNVQWIISENLIAYTQALNAMTKRVASIIENQQPELVWLLEHPPLYTAGVSAKATDLLVPDFPVYNVRRGGQYTYHGPGQRVGYVMLNIANRGRDIHKFVWQLEEWIIQTLKYFGISGERRKNRVGVWVIRDNKEMKIAAIGIKLRKWVSFHGVSINIDPDLDHYKAIVPCGISQYGVTSCKEMGANVSIKEVDIILKKEFSKIFG